MISSNTQKPSADIILAIETSTPVCSVALKAGDSELVKTETGTGIHSEKTFIFIDELLAEAGLKPADVQVVVLSGGPGSYTGLRIASSAAKGLLFGRESALYSCQTLASIAAGVHRNQKAKRIHAVLNARRTHLYHQMFQVSDDGILTHSSPSSVLALSEIESVLEKGDVVAGTGIQRLSRDLLLEKQVRTYRDDEALSASNLLYMMKTDDFLPYLREEDVASYEPVYQPPEA
ncbi:MAG: tRNA (adenosine(37)-N6)-threonylcarbamoyltransferase complex dimerization subunit type 1 TsaB [Balneolia bacterium]|nr:tRNA (adenosine(37)-N6)-threonylcarbamoyltransferase complex dimerization subunit type 1 TsaB [Balneolia bacterium]